MDTQELLENWVHSFNHEERQKDFIIMIYRAIHTFDCTRMEAYQKTASAYHFTESMVRNLHVKAMNA